MTFALPSELLCPTKICKDKVYVDYIGTYLLNSICDKDNYESILSQLPTYITFILGNELFNNLTVAVESYRKYKNYTHLSDNDPVKAKNYKYLIDQNRKAFNDAIEAIPELIDTRRSLLLELEQTLLETTSVTDLIDETKTFVVEDYPEMKERLMYIINLVNNHRNILENSVNSYETSYENVAIA
jgi:hypothetical protein